MNFTSYADKMNLTYEDTIKKFKDNFEKVKIIRTSRGNYSSEFKIIVRDELDKPYNFIINPIKTLHSINWIKTWNNL